MSLRIKLALLFLALAIVPLIGLVLYSYDTSRRALRSSSESEALVLAEDLEDRMAVVRDNFEQRFASVAAEPWVVETLDPGETAEATAAPRQQLVQHLLDKLGDSATLIESFEFVPAPPAAAVAPAPPEVDLPPAAPAPAAPVAPAVTPPEVTAPPATTPPATAPPALDAEAEAAAGAKLAETLVPATLVLVQQALQMEGEDLETELEESFGDLSVELIDIGIDALAGQNEDEGTTEARIEVAAERFTQRWRAVITPNGDAVPQPPQPGEAQVVLMAPQPGIEVESLEVRNEVVQEFEHQVRWHWSESRSSAEEDGAETGDFEWGEENREHQEKLEELFGPEFGVPVFEGGNPIGQVLAQVRAEELLRQVLVESRRDQGEIPFALDAEANLVVADEADRATLEGILPGTETEAGRAEALDRGWVVVRRSHGDEGLEFGIARPIGESLEQVRLAARKSFGMGLALIVVALIGVLPLADRVTRNLRKVTESAGRIAEGDLEARVPVRSRDEVGNLARAFNDMAAKLAVHEERLLDDERKRHEAELERQRLEAEVDRKSQELEEARQFQLSLLPKQLPNRTDADLAVHMETATEVGGDYYDLFEEDGTLVLAVGDATGHGARAGTMVTVTKSLVASYRPGSGPEVFLDQASETIRRMDLGRMAMALLLAEWSEGTLRLAAAGMPPVLIHRAQQGAVEEVGLPGLPLGGRLATGYATRTLELSPGDTLLLMSDGFPELLDNQREPLGYDRVRSLFAEAAATAVDAQSVVSALHQHVEQHQAGPRPSDDVTFVVLRAT